MSLETAVNVKIDKRETLSFQFMLISQTVSRKNSNTNCWNLNFEDVQQIIGAAWDIL